MPYQLITTDWVSMPSPEGVEYCRTDAPAQCARTNASGIAMFPDLPARTQLVLSVRHDGDMDLLKHFVTPQPATTMPRDPFVRLISHERWTRWANQAGVKLEPDKGHIWFFVLTSVSAKVELRPTAGTRVYFRSMDELDPTLETSGPTGHGIVFNVPPGEYDAVFSAPGRRCQFGMETGWPGTTPDASRVTVKAGFISFPAFGVCLPE